MFIRLDMGPAQQLRGDNGEVRMIYRVNGGHFTGDRLSGQVLPVVGDWASIKDGQVTMDVRVQLRTDDGVDVLMAYEGILPMEDGMRDLLPPDARLSQSGHHFRVTPSLEVRGAGYEWLAKAKIFGVGIRFADAIEYHVYEAACCTQT
ncbi:DUF3237 domain-containing protein [Pseudooceanicola sp.]